MKNQQYWKNFRRELRGLERAQLNDIIAELQNEGVGLSDDELEARFGSAESLAENYREELGFVKAERRGRKTVRNVLAVTGGLSLLLFGGCAFFAWKFATEDHHIYDYTDEAARAAYWEEAKWQSIGALTTEPIRIEQAKVAWYFESREDVLIACTSKNGLLIDPENAIQRAKCVVRSPAQPIVIDVRQSSVAIIEPTNQITITSDQSALQFKYDSTLVRVVVDARESKVDDFDTGQQAEHVIMVNADQSRIIRL